MEIPSIKQAIPAQVVNERAAYGPFDLKPFFNFPSLDEVYFTAQLENGQSLPKGMICTGDGLLTGIPAQKTQGHYDVIIIASNDEGEIESPLSLTIKASLATDPSVQGEPVKARIWEALHNNLPIPELADMYNLPVTPLDVYYLLERWGTITIWDAYNLEAPDVKTPLALDGMSEHFHVYDCGSCIIGVPKNLYSHERTLEDGLKTARAMAREVYQRQWAVDLSGFDKYTRAAWIEIQLLGDKYAKKLEVINFHPTLEDMHLYSVEATSKLKIGSE